jgi:hypothetical protein
MMESDVARQIRCLLDSRAMGENRTAGISSSLFVIRVTFLEKVLEGNGVPASFRAPPNKVVLHEAEKRRAAAGKS